MTDGTYVITVRGVAGPWVRAAFDDVAIRGAGGTTVLRRARTDQAALHGFLRRIHDLGLELLDVHRESAERVRHQATNPLQDRTRSAHDDASGEVRRHDSQR
jgi:hypothetical protein